LDSVSGTSLLEVLLDRITKFDWVRGSLAPDIVDLNGNVSEVTPLQVIE
jgi:hypothetical protein